MENKIIFDKENHEYILDGKKLPSVTQILEQTIFADKYCNIDEEVLKKAADKGTLVHKEIEDYIKRDALGFTDELYNFITIKEDNKLSDLKSEVIVHNNEIAGTIDIIAIKGGKGQQKQNILADIKTTCKLDKEYVSWQLSFYAYLYENMYNEKIDELYAIWLRDEKYKFIKVERKNEKQINDVLVAFKNGLKMDFSTSTLQTISKETQINFCTYMKQIKAIEEKTAEIKEAILKEMEERGISKIDLGDITITYKAPSTKTSVDSKKLKEDGIYDKYTKTSNVKSSILIKVKQ